MFVPPPTIVGHQGRMPTKYGICPEHSAGDNARYRGDSSGLSTEGRERESFKRLRAKRKADLEPERGRWWGEGNEMGVRGPRGGWGSLHPWGESLICSVIFCDCHVDDNSSGPAPRCFPGRAATRHSCTAGSWRGDRRSGTPRGPLPRHFLHHIIAVTRISLAKITQRNPKVFVFELVFALLGMRHVTSITARGPTADT